MIDSKNRKGWIDMKPFMDEDFLLQSETAKKLYHDYAEKMPIIDYHCHINPQEIYEDKQFASITEAWLGGDHYKWRVVRANGYDEKYVTGAGSDWEKFEAWANTLPKCIGNPLYHWTHLELKRYFGCGKPLNGGDAREIFDLCNQKLGEKEMSVRGIIKQSNVKLICTTDSPADTLEWHKKLAADKTLEVKVLPAFRPDKTVNIEKPGFVEYVAEMEKACGMKIATLGDMKKALALRLDYFGENGCRVSDHGLDYCVCSPADEKELDRILAKALAGETVTQEEADQYKTGLLLFLGEEYAKRGWVMQIHFGCLRNNNSAMFRKLGPDTGYDAMGNSEGAARLAGFLNCLEERGALPKTILYSLNDADNSIIASVMGCFQKDVAGKMQLGSAWWFNDSKTGMVKQLTDLANGGVLGNFIGMLTDSRSFLSYTRHEYFRRILCNLIGQWVEDGEYPCDMEFLGKMVQDISYNNTVRYFGFEL